MGIVINYYYDRLTDALAALQGQTQFIVEKYDDDGKFQSYDNVQLSEFVLREREKLAS